MRGVVAPSELAIVRQFRLHLVELFLVDQRRDGSYGQPSSGIDLSSALRVRSNGLQRRVAHTRWPRPGAPGIDVAGVGGIGQDAVHGARTPAGFAHGRRNALRREIFG